MKILVIGSGAREHAIVRSLLKDDGVSVVCAPGNAGISQDCSVRQINTEDGAAVVELAQELAIDLVVIGPEAPLVAGVADALIAAKIPVFGPTKAAAELEGSKAFAKEIMQIAGVPTARAFVCSEIESAAQALNELGAPYVVKNDGLAAGKGVVVTNDYSVAIAHAEECFAVGGTVVIEEYLDGPEISLFGVSDGATVLPLSPAQDFKRIGDGDSGPNTGGMGAYSPLPWAPVDIMQRVQNEILTPMIVAMAQRGTPFAGLLYAGLAMTAKGIRVIEFNARFGDPETQVVLTRLRSPLSKLLYAAATGTLSSHPALEWSDESAVTVVMAAAGYPAAPQTGEVISGLADIETTEVFHAGTKFNAQDEIISSGGRVLSVTATGADLTQARRNAYSALANISFSGEQHRTDIAQAAAEGRIHL